MIIELSVNEAMWINDKIAQECIRGQKAIDNIKDDESMKEAVDMAREIVVKLSKLGIRLCHAIEKELDEKETKATMAN